MSYAYRIDDHNEDVYIAAKQVSQYLLGSYYIDCQNSYKYLSRDNEEMELMYDKHRLVKKDGYEILLSNVDDIQFTLQDNNVYMAVQREDTTFHFLVGYAREKYNEEENENIE